MSRGDGETRVWQYYRDSRDYQVAGALWALGMIAPEDVTWVAAEALQRGDDTQAIREVAGLIHPTRRNDGATVCRMFSDLGVPSFSHTDALDVLVRVLLHRIKDGDDREFDLVMADVRSIWSKAVVEDSSAVTHWRELEDTMWADEEIGCVFGRTGNRRSNEEYRSERAKLIASARSWAQEVLKRTE